MVLLLHTWHICNKLELYKKVIIEEEPSEEPPPPNQRNTNNDDENILVQKWKQWENWAGVAQSVVDKYNQIIQEGPAKLAENWGIALSLIEGIEETRREDARIYVENIMRKFYYDPKLLVTSPQHIIY